MGKKKDISKCPQCGGDTTCTAEPLRSRIVIRCSNADCDYESYYPVRASALSLFGVIALALTVVAGVVGALCVGGLGYHGIGTWIGVLIGLVIGHFVVRFVVRFVAIALLTFHIPFSWIEEIVAHLAPPPFLKQSAMIAKHNDEET